MAGSFPQIDTIVCCQTRENDEMNIIDRIMSDLRLALRSILRRPGFAVAVCGTLALGVGTVTTMFTFVNSILLNPLPFPKSDELVQICVHDHKANKTSVLVSIPDVMDWKQQATSFADMAYYRSGIRP